MFHPEGPTFQELLAQALSSTERGYDLLAPKFDHTPFRTPEAVLDAVSRVLAASGPFRSGLDLCCGTGAGMRMLRPHCSELVVGLDFSRGMIEAGQRQLSDSPGQARLEWVRANALQLPLTAAFDIVVCFGACGHVLERDQAQFIRGVASILRPRGRFVMVTSHLPAIWSPARWLAKSFNAAMHVRNWLVAPPFVMYYLTFLLPRVQHDLERAGFTVEVQPLAAAGLTSRLRLVSATLSPGSSEPGGPGPERPR